MKIKFPRNTEQDSHSDLFSSSWINGMHLRSKRKILVQLYKCEKCEVRIIRRSRKLIAGYNLAKNRRHPLVHIFADCTIHCSFLSFAKHPTWAPLPWIKLKKIFPHFLLTSFDLQYLCKMGLCYMWIKWIICFYSRC